MFKFKHSLSITHYNCIINVIHNRGKQAIYFIVRLKKFCRGQTPHNVVLQNKSVNKFNSGGTTSGVEHS